MESTMNFVFYLECESEETRKEGGEVQFDGIERTQRLNRGKFVEQQIYLMFFT